MSGLTHPSYAEARVIALEAKLDRARIAVAIVNDTIAEEGVMEESTGDVTLVGGTLEKLGHLFISVLNDTEGE